MENVQKKLIIRIPSLLPLALSATGGFCFWRQNITNAKEECSPSGPALDRMNGKRTKLTEI